MIECATIRDLLPLYVDDVLSKESKALISDHLATCESCRDELTKMQSEFVKLPANGGAKFDALKLIKKKLFGQKVIVAVVASVLAVAVAAGGYWVVFHHDTPIKYTIGLAQVKKGGEVVNGYYDDTYEDPFLTETRTYLKLLTSRQHYASYAVSRKVSINGVDTEVVYIYLSETLSTKWQAEDKGEQVIQLACIGDDFTISRSNIGNPLSFLSGDIGNSPTLPMEIYYLAMPFKKILGVGDEDFYKLRTAGVLLWNGTLVAEEANK